MTRPGITRDRWIALFLFGVLAFSPPLLLMFSAPATVFGAPVLYVYLFLAWGALIGLMAWIAEAQTVRKGRGRRR